MWIGASYISLNNKGHNHARKNSLTLVPSSSIHPPHRRMQAAHIHTYSYSMQIKSSQIIQTQTKTDEHQPLAAAAKSPLYVRFGDG